MRRNQILFLGITIGITLLCFQGGTWQVNKVKEADKKFKKLAYADARAIYLQLVNTGYKPPNVLSRLGDTYYFEGDRENAVEWYAELITKYSDYLDDYLFRYAQSLKTLKLYDLAIEAMREYYDRKGADPGFLIKKRKNNYVDFIEKQSGSFSLFDFQYNSACSDLSPNFSPNGGLVFSSNRCVASPDGNSAASQPSMDIYQVSGTKPERVPEVVNTRLHESSLVYTKDGKTVYFSRSNQVNSENGKAPEGRMRTALYRATVKNGQWKNARKLPFSSNRYAVSHPALSPDEKKLYFVSNMPGSRGKSDIFYATIEKDGTFGNPVNLGNTINTLGNETSPFIAPNGDLYFASDTHFGFGGLDIFISRYKDGKYEEPVNLGKPINTVRDDLSFIIDDNNKIGYFASDRNLNGIGKRDYNIYKCKQQKALLFHDSQFVHGKITGLNTSEGIPSCIVKILDQNLKEVARTTSDEDGYYHLNLQNSDTHTIRVSKPSYLLTEKILHINGFTKKDIALPIQLKKGDGLVTNLVYAGDGFDEAVEISNIYFDMDAIEIRADAELEMKKVITVLKNIRELTINIRSYTDSKGSDDYNMKLSKKRAMATKNYLVKNGKIAPGRISIEAMGRSKALADCGEHCSYTDHQLNRRSEFIILK